MPSVGPGMQDHFKKQKESLERGLGVECGCREKENSKNNSEAL